MRTMTLNAVLSMAIGCACWGCCAKSTDEPLAEPNGDPTPKPQAASDQEADEGAKQAGASPKTDPQQPIDPRPKMPKNVSESLKHIALAFHRHHDENRAFPTSLYDSDGNPLLSWRVVILPHLGQQDLFEKFHLDEPWDSPHNLTLLDEMPEVYGEGNETRMMIFTGTDAIFHRDRKRGFVNVYDGTTDTILVVQVANEKRVPWTKPVDLDIDQGDPLELIGDIGDSQIAAAWMDGHLSLLPKDISSDRLMRLIHPDDGGRIEKHVADLIGAGEHEAALQQLVWLDQMMDEPDQGIGMFGSHYRVWSELGGKYPPALEKLKVVRAAKTGAMYRVELSEWETDLRLRFSSIRRLNEALGEPDRTIDLFLELRTRRPKLANELAASWVGRDVLIENGMGKVYAECAYQDAIDELKIDLEKRTSDPRYEEQTNDSHGLGYSRYRFEGLLRTLRDEGLTEEAAWVMSRLAEDLKSLGLESAISEFK